jgi:DNA-binding transcriptional LysR family regulator
MSERLAGVAAFVAAVETGSFAAAGGRLGLSRSAVGKTLARLEGRLGVRLLHRTTRSLSLTEDGQAFYERCVRALAELEAAESALEAGRREPAGRVRLTAPLLVGRRLVAPVLRELAVRHPALELEASFSGRPVDLVEERYDVAVRSGPLPDTTGLKARKLGTQPMAVCASPGYLAAHGTPASLEALAGHRAVLYAREGQTRPWRFPDGKGGLTLVPMQGRVRFDDVEAVADAAEAGAGLAWVPAWLVAERLRAGALVHVLPDVEPLHIDVHAVWPHAPHLPLRLRAVLDALAARVPGMLGGGLGV